MSQRKRHLAAISGILLKVPEPTKGGLMHLTRREWVAALLAERLYQQYRRKQKLGEK